MSLHVSVHVSRYWGKPEDERETFQVGLSISSIEHDGLGRYHFPLFFSLFFPFLFLPLSMMDLAGIIFSCFFFPVSISSIEHHGLAGIFFLFSFFVSISSIEHDGLGMNNVFFFISFVSFFYLVH